MSEVKPEVVLFVCEKYPMLNMVISHDRTAIIDGEVIRVPHESIGFRKTNYGGHYQTDNPLHIKKIRESPQYKEGHIVEVDEKALKDLERKPGGQPVHQGVSGTMPRTPEPVAPVEVQKSVPAAAKVPSKSF